MRQNHGANFPGIHHGQKPLATKIHPSANLFDKLHVGEAACRTELFQGKPLVLQIETRTLVADATIGNDSPSTCAGPLVPEAIT